VDSVLGKALLIAVALAVAWAVVRRQRSKRR
jgi:hypothetical protein